MEEIKNNLGDYLFLNSTSLYDEWNKHYDTRLPKIYGINGKLMYVDYKIPFILTSSLEKYPIDGTLVHTLNGKIFIIKRNDRDGYYLMDNNGIIIGGHFDKIEDNLKTNKVAVLSKSYFKNSKMTYVYTIVTENGIIWEDTYLPDQLFLDSGYYILRDNITTPKLGGIALEVLYNNCNQPIKASINGDLIQYYETIKKDIISKDMLLDGRIIIEEYIKKQLRELWLGSNDDKLVDMIINANINNILLVISLNSGQVLTFKSPELEELTEENENYLKRLRSHK